MLRDLQPIIDARNPDSPVTYTVTFDSMGGSEVPSQTVEEGGLVIEPDIRPTRAGYGFYAWYKEAECINAWDFAVDTVTEDITLYARWVEEGLFVTVTFDDNYAGGSSASNLVLPGETAPAPAVPTRDGFIFDGWYTEADTIHQFNFDTHINTDFTLYAKWVGIIVSGGSTTVLGEAKTPLTITADTVGILSYQWQYSANGTSGWEDINGATEAVYTPPANLGSGNHYYRCVVTNSGLNSGLLTATAASNTVTLTVTDPTGADTVYIITGSGTSYTARLGSAAGPVVGTANEPIQSVIDAVRINANGEDCEIQFGSGAVLNIDNANITFDGTWGEVTLTGSITSSYSSSAVGMIHLADSVIINSTATITSTTAATSAIRFDEAYTGTVTISGGTVSGGSGGRAIMMARGNLNVSGDAVITSGSSGGTIYASSGASGNIVISGNAVIRNIAAGDGRAIDVTQGIVTLTIENGTVEATQGGSAIGAGAGAVTITGGTVSANTGRAIVNEGAGLITISGTAEVTSRNTAGGEGTIQLSGSSTTERLRIEGGMVQNTSNTPDSKAIRNDTNGGVTISGGTVRATPPATAYAVYSAGAGALNIDWDNAVIDGLVHPAPVISITSQPAATTTLTAGSISGSLSTTATVTLGVAVSYQWYSNTSASASGGTQVSGATGTTFTIPTTLTPGTYYYYCVVSATLGAVPLATEVATVIVQQSAVFTIRYTHITDDAPNIAGLPNPIIISRTGNGHPQTYEIELSNPGDYTLKQWIIAGTSIVETGDSFILDANNPAYSGVDVDRELSLLVTAGGVPYAKTIPFRVVQ